MGGLWEMPGVPHKGWRCVGVEDLRPDGAYGGDYERGTCEMCLNATLRFVHTMEHDEYPEPVEAGCVCAERMADEYDGKAREAKLKRLARSKVKAATWHTSNYITDGSNVSASAQRPTRNQNEPGHQWLQRHWRISEKGNPYLNITDCDCAGYNVGVFKRNGHPTGWIWRIDGEFGRTRFPTERMAKLALYEVLVSRLGFTF